MGERRRQEDPHGLRVAGLFCYCWGESVSIQVMGLLGWENACETCCQHDGEPGEAGRMQVPPPLQSTTYTFDDVLAVNKCYQEKGWTDGLPIVPPTAAQVTACLGFCRKFSLRHFEVCSSSLSHRASRGRALSQVPIARQRVCCGGCAGLWRIRCARARSKYSWKNGGEVDHATITRWGLKDSPPLAEACHRRQRAVWGRGRMEAPSMKGKGPGHSRDRAVDHPSPPWTVGAPSRGTTRPRGGC
jgi:hypothetical protein